MSPKSIENIVEGMIHVTLNSPKTSLRFSKFYRNVHLYFRETEVSEAQNKEHNTMRRKEAKHFGVLC